VRQGQEIGKLFGEKQRRNQRAGEGYLQAKRPQKSKARAQSRKGKCEFSKITRAALTREGAKNNCPFKTALGEEEKGFRLEGSSRGHTGI